MNAFIGVLFLGGICSTYSASVGVLRSSPCANQYEGALVSVPGECSKFYICFNGQAIESSCGEGAHFEPVSSLCIVAAESKCTYTAVDAETHAEPEPEPVMENLENICTARAVGTFVASKTSCSEYYVCIGTNAVAKTCKDGFFFSPDSRSCTIPELANCVVGAEEPIDEGFGVEAEAAEPEAEEVKAEEVLIVEVEVAEPVAGEESAPSDSVLTTIFTETSCRGQPDGAMFPVAGSCSKYIACLQEIIFEQTCGLRHFDPLSRSCIIAAYSSCKVEGEEPLPEEQSASAVCRGQPDGAMLPVAGSCSTYFACLQGIAFKQTCGLRHFDPSTRSCIVIADSKCVEGEVVADLSAVVKVMETPVEGEQVHSIGDTNFGSENNGVFIGNANIDIANSGYAGAVNLVSGSSNVIYSNNDYGSNNNYEINPNYSAEQAQSAEEHVIIAESQNASIGDTNLGQNNSGIFIGNANLSINNTGTISKANIVTASKDVVIDNTNLGFSNSYTVNGGQLVGNNKTIQIKHTGLPLNKNKVSHVDTLDIDVSNSGISVESHGVLGSVDIGSADLNQSNQGIFIGNANVNISNSGFVSDVNIVSGSQNVIVSNTEVGSYNEIVVSQVEEDNKEIVLAMVDEQSSAQCIGMASGTLLPKTDNCREFLTCEGGVAFVGLCPRGLHFNPNAKFCDWPELAGCA